MLYSLGERSLTIACDGVVVMRDKDAPRYPISEGFADIVYYNNCNGGRMDGLKRWRLERRQTCALQNLKTGVFMYALCRTQLSFHSIFSILDFGQKIHIQERSWRTGLCLEEAAIKNLRLGKPDYVVDASTPQNGIRTGFFSFGLGRLKVQFRQEHTASISWDSTMIHSCLVAFSIVAHVFFNPFVFGKEPWLLSQTNFPVFSDLFNQNIG